MGSACVLAFAGNSQGQWIHFEDEAETRLELVSIPDDDGKEKDTAVADVNRDGWDDIIIVRKAPFSTPGAEADVLLLNVNGRLEDKTAEFAPEFITNPTDARDVLVTDLDGDQWPDVVIANTFGEDPVYYRNRGNDPQGNWLGFIDESATRLPSLGLAKLQFCALWAGDVTGDGAPDIYFSNYVKPPEIALDVLLINDGDGNFTDESAARLGDLRNSAFGTSIEIDDMDGDGDLDLVKTSSLYGVPPWPGVGVFVLFNDGTGNFKEFQDVPSASPYMFTLGDVNEDGLPDIYIVNDSQDYLLIAESVDHDRDTPIEYLKIVLVDSPRTAFLGGNCKFADVDNDGDLDIGVADVDIDIGICENDPSDPRKMALLQNAGDATGDLVDPWGPNSNPWNLNTFDFSFIDVDRDGKLDVFSALCSGYAVFRQGNFLRTYPDELNFDGALTGAVSSRTFLLCNNGSDPTRVTSIASSLPEFSVAHDAFTLAPFECREISVNYTPANPGSVNATLEIAGDQSVTVGMTGEIFDPPRLEVDQLEVCATSLPGESQRIELNITNTGGSDLVIDLQPLVDERPIGNLLVIAKDSVLPLIEEGLNGSGVGHVAIEPSEINTVDLSGYEMVILALAGDSIRREDMVSLAAAVDVGLSLVIVGASSDAGFLEVLNDSLITHESDGVGWAAPDGFHFRATDGAHPLNDGLPTGDHSFSNEVASWYRIRVSDPDARVAAENGDGWPVLMSKPVGDGLVLFFANWPLSFVWTAPDDAAFFRQFMTNVLSFLRTSWLSVTPRSRIVGVGESVTLVLNFNTLDQLPGIYRAGIRIGSNDPRNSELEIPVRFDILTGPDDVKVVHYQPDGLVGESLEGLIGRGIYNADSRGQSLLLQTRRLRAVRCWWAIQNDGEFRDTFSCRATRGNRYFDIRYWNNDENRTGELVSGAFETSNLAPKDPPENLLAEIIPRRQFLRRRYLGGSRRVYLRRSQTAVLTAVSQADAVKLDQVKVKVRFDRSWARNRLRRY